MKDARFQILLILMLLVAFIPVADAYETDWMTSWISGPDEVYPGGEYVFTLYSEGYWYINGESTLYISNGFEIMMPEHFSGCYSGPEYWTCTFPDQTSPTDVFLKVKPETSPGTVLWIKNEILWEAETIDHELIWEHDYAEKMVTVIAPPAPVPEFPSLILPAALVTGLAAAATCLRRLQ